VTGPTITVVFTGGVPSAVAVEVSE